MTTDTLAPATRHSRGRTVRHVVRHYLEMVVAMLAGMIVLGPVWSLLWPGLTQLTIAHTLVMATDMALGMGAWMRFRGHSWSAIGVMSSAMWGPFRGLVVPSWPDATTPGTLMTAGHLL